MLANRIKTGLWAMTVLCGGLLSLISPANADTRQQGHLRGANIPFAFRIGNNSLPAGKYRLEQWTPGSPSYYLKNIATGKSLMVTYLGGKEQRPTQLIFEKDETGYVLRKLQ